MVDPCERRGREPGVELAREGAMAVVEERPVERAAIGTDFGRAASISDALSIALEFRPALGGEGFEGAAEILRRHADRLRLRLRLR